MSHTARRLRSVEFLLDPITGERIYIDARQAGVACCAINPFTGEIVTLPDYTDAHSFAPPPDLQRHDDDTVVAEERVTVATIQMLQARRR